LNFCVEEYDHFKTEKFVLDDYKFGLVDNDENITVHQHLDEEFYEILRASLGNLIIAGKNLDFERLKTHDLFREWFDKYSNRY